MSSAPTLLLPLPLATPQELASLLQSPHLEGSLRPGCVHLTLEALVQVRGLWWGPWWGLPACRGDSLLVLVPPCTKHP